MYQLYSLKQPDNDPETKHHEKFKTIIEVFKTSGINFSVMSFANIDMSFTSLHNSNQIQSRSIYKVGDYFKLGDVTRKLVDNKSKEICLSTCFISLSFNKFHYRSKQELVNNMIKGVDNYPRDISSVLSFL